MPNDAPQTSWSTVPVNGLSFAYYEEGEGPLVLLVHGFPDTAHTWDKLRPRIAALGYRVVTPFTRGIGPTESPLGDKYSGEDLGRDILGLIAALGEESAIVVGHDWGALAAYAAAHIEPQRISKLVTVAIPHPATLKPDFAKIWGARHFVTLRLPGAARRLRAAGLDGIRTFHERWSPGHVWSDSDLEEAANAYAAEGGAEAALGYYRCFKPGIPSFMADKLNTPTLVIGGLTDGVATASDFERSTRKFDDGCCTIRMLPGGHFLHLEHPDPFMDCLTAFLAQP